MGEIGIQVQNGRPNFGPHTGFRAQSDGGRGEGLKRMKNAIIGGCIGMAARSPPTLPG